MYVSPSTTTSSSKRDHAGQRWSRIISIGPTFSALGIIGENTFASSVQVSELVPKARCMLATLDRAFTRITPQIFIPKYSAVVCLQLG